MKLVGNFDAVLKPYIEQGKTLIDLQRDEGARTMTEYWVSQGNKWCEYCKTYVANNGTSVRTHELGERHKNNVAKRLQNIQKNNAIEERDKLRAMKEMEHIEAKAVRSYVNDVKANHSSAAGPTLTSSKINEAGSNQHTYTGKSTTVQRAEAAEAKSEWVDDSSGYKYNPVTGHYYDPTSGFYYSDALGQWTTEEQALKAAQTSKKPTTGPPRKPPAPGAYPVGTSSKSQQFQHPTKGRPSTFDVASHKRKKQESGGNNRPRKRNSSQELAAQAAREAARKRVKEREKSLMGLYQGY